MRIFKKVFLIYLLAEFLGGYTGMLNGPHSYAWGQSVYGPALSQSLTVSTVAPPANTPLLGTSNLFCSGSAGSFSAGTFVVAYTYTGTASSSETKASSDGGATLTTLVTCPTNGTLTIPSPPSPPGCFNCVGWRPYVIASSSGTGAELLQTITAANCILATTASLTSCAIGSSFTETSLGAGAAEPSNPTLFTPTPGGFASLSEANLGIVGHYLTWTTTGTAATCTVAVQTSSDNISFSTVGTAQTCTSSGAYWVNATAANFTRVNITAFTASGANTPSIAFTLAESLGAVPVYSITNCGTTTTCTPNATLSNPQIKIVVGTCTAAAATTCTVTAMPAFTSTTSYVCNVTDQTTAANGALKAANVSSSSFTITTASSSDTFSYVCVGT